MRNNTRFDETQSLRVASGKFKGMKLISPNSPGTHPMGSREKLALFNLVDSSQAKVLDAFAGSGALGIEALSRGAEEVVFVEKSPRAVQIIQENLANLATHEQAISARTKVFRQKVASFAENQTFSNHFDLIIADPPYNNIDYSEIGQLVPLLSDGGKLVLSSPADQPVPDFSGMESISSRTYARARLTVYIT